MGSRDLPARTALPPTPVLLVVIGLAIVVPLGSWAWVGIREWALGDSPAAALGAPYFWGLLLFRAGGAIGLAFLLCLLRTPASIWITVTSVWLAGPPLQLLYAGIDVLSASGGQRSLPDSPLQMAVWLSVGPAIVTICLLGFRSSRQAYGFSTPGSD